MQNKTISLSIIALLCFSMLQGCYDDNGNYDYETINEITIDFGDDVINGCLDQGLSDTLKIDPALTFSEDTEDNLSYFWYCNDEEILTEKELIYPVKELTGERPYVKLKVTNNQDSSSFVEGFYVDIVSDFLTGWVVLTKDGERGILSYIDADDFSTYTDFYTLKSGEELGSDAIRVQEHWPFDAMAVGSIMVIRNSSEGNIEIDGEDLNPLYNTNNFFLNATPPDDYRSLGEYYTWQYSIILDDNGNLYQRKYDDQTAYQSGVYSNVPYYVGDGVEIANGWSGSWISGLTLFYDKTNGALYVASDFGSIMAMSFVNVFAGTGDYTFIDDMDKELIYAGQVKVGNNVAIFYLVYKSDDSSYRVQEIQVIHSGTYCTVLHQGEDDFGDGNITENTVFCQLDRKSDYMFFSGGENEKTLYLYEHTTSNLSEYYTFDSPIKTITAGFSQNTSGYSNNELMVGLENGDMVFLGITYEDLTKEDPEERLLQCVELGEGTPVGGMCKCGYQYTQYY